MIDLLPNIPRLHTGFAEWLACIVVLLAIPPQKKETRFYGLAILMGCGQIALQLWVETWPLFFWLGGMILNVLWMLFTFTVLAKRPLLNQIYLVCKAFILAEFMAAFTWQLYCYLFFNRLEERLLIQLLFTFTFYLLISGSYFFIEKKSNPLIILSRLKKKDVLTVFLTAVIIFTMSNIGFILSTTSFALGDIVTIFIFRSLINLAGLLLIYIQEKSRYENYLQEELTAVNKVFLSQYEQYETYRESTQIINQKFHDLKHQLDIIELEENQEKRIAYVTQIKADLQKHQFGIKTGNPIIDVVLSRKNIYCIEHQITFTCIVDGALLNGLETMDLVSLLGNALDNAIESCLLIPEIEKRLINLRVSKKADFVLFSLENYTEADLVFDNDLPVTTKDDPTYHGYGLKSIHYIAEKYHGSMTINLEDNWFQLNVLLPISKSMKEIIKVK